MKTSDLQAFMLCAVAVASTVASTGCLGAEVDAGYPGGPYGYYPSDAYIATTEPWYFDGRATYWWGGHWYFRNGGRWGYYRHEPAALYHRRMIAGQRHYSFESRGRGGRSEGHR